MIITIKQIIIRRRRAGKPDCCSRPWSSSIIRRTCACISALPAACKSSLRSIFQILIFLPPLSAPLSVCPSLCPPLCPSPPPLLSPLLSPSLSLSTAPPLSPSLSRASSRILAATHSCGRTADSLTKAYGQSSRVEFVTKASSHRGARAPEPLLSLNSKCPLKVHMCVYIYIYTYIHIERERETPGPSSKIRLSERASRW